MSSRKRALLCSKVESLALKKSHPRTTSYFCPHCEADLCSKTYKKHRNLYYKADDDEWIKVKDLTAEVPENSHQLQLTVEDSAPALPISEVEEMCGLTTTYCDHNIDGNESSLPQSEDCLEDVFDFEDEEEEECWEEDSEELELNFPSDESPTNPEQNLPTQGSEVNLLTWLLLFIIRLQAKHYIPDVAINSLLKFLFLFFSIAAIYSDFVAGMVAIFPTSLYLLRKYFALTEDFTRFVVCRKCYSVYSFDSCVNKSGTLLVSKQCQHRAHPNSRLSCSTLLLKTVNLLSGKKKLYPFKVYCYSGLQHMLQKLLLRPGFVESCEQWRSRVNRDNKLSDIYDAQIWKDFQYIKGESFLASPHVYAVMINIDWFQPYKHTQASVGAIYLTIMNLPYTYRYKRENIILLGIIPGPSEPPRDINQYLRPIVKELLQFYGVEMNIHNKSEKVIVKCILIGVPCDMPARRKACGFLGHSANLGCTKCLKKFPGQVGSKDYSGFDKENWKLRTDSDHRKAVEKIKKAENKTKRDSLESKYGCRYSVLLDLPYFDPIRMLLIDPMHNLFLGTAKRMLRIWDDHNVLDLSNKRVCEQIQSKIDNMHVPTDIGRIPRKVETRFSGFTADQYKNWVVFYSIPCLNEIIDDDHLECWRHFVLACRIICQRTLSSTDIILVDALLLQFCRRVQRLYGNNAITPNMHMHCHLKSALLDYGPVYGFWLFSYERYNGILQHQPSSNHCIEIQIMRRFLQDNTAFAIQPPTEFTKELGNITTLEPKASGSLLLMTKEVCGTDLELPSCYTYHALTMDEAELVKKMLMVLHSLSGRDISVNTSFRKFKFVAINGARIPSSSNRNVSVVLGNKFTGEDPDSRPCKIHSFIQVSYIVNGNILKHDFAVVSWYQEHPSRHSIGKPVQIWSKDLFDCDGVHTYLSLTKSSIYRCIHTIIKLPHTLEEVFAVIPLIQ